MKEFAMPNPPKREREALEYQEAMLGELCRMASENRQELLGYLLGMAYMEVRALLGKTADSFAQPPLAREMSGSR
jgi:hypothetical protein